MGSPEPFPTDLPLYDAHCHPTDVMSSVERIPGMRARALVIMASRRQDQHLVSEAASPQHGVLAAEDLSGSSGRKIIPAFGWHPWFSHQLVDDTSSPMAEDEESKRAHYAKVLAPPPAEATLAQLPPPTSLATFLRETKARLETHPSAVVGEIGLDKTFRLPEPWTAPALARRDSALTPGGREGRRLGPHHVTLDHQAAVLRAQLRLAGDMCRPVSVHGVAAHGALYDVISALWEGHEKDVVSSRERKRIAPHAEDWSSSGSDSDSDSDADGGRPGAKKRKERKKMKPVVKPAPFPPRICLHSFSASTEVLGRYLKPHVPARMYFSFSACVNLAKESAAPKLVEVLRMIPDDRILIESDLHEAGAEMDGALGEICRFVCEAKGWGIKDGVKILRRNFEEFVFG